MVGGTLELNLSIEWIVRGLLCTQNVYYRIVIVGTGQEPGKLSIKGRDP